MKRRIVACVDCKRELTRKQLNRNLRCPVCAGRAVTNNMRQLHEHNGPAYKKWQQAMLANIDRIKAGVNGGDHV